jgi:hypothetical protein
MEIPTSIRSERSLKVTSPATFPRQRSVDPANAAKEFETEHLTSFRSIARLWKSFNLYHSSLELINRDLRRIHNNLSCSSNCLDAIFLITPFMSQYIVIYRRVLRICWFNMWVLKREMIPGDEFGIANSRMGANSQSTDWLGHPHSQFHYCEISGIFQRVMLSPLSLLVLLFEYSE